MVNQHISQQSKKASKNKKVDNLQITKSQIKNISLIDQ